MFFRVTQTILTFLLQGIGFAVETFLVMLGLMSLWNGFIVEKAGVHSMGITVALLLTIVVRFLIWLPVFARRSGEGTATDVDLGDRPEAIGTIEPLKKLEPITKAPNKPIPPPKVASS